MKLIDVKSNSYISFSKEINNNGPNCMFLSCHVRVFRVNPHSIVA